MTGADMYDVVLLAICCWREARNQPLIAKTGQAYTVRNRLAHPGWWGHSYATIILMPFQYSSFNHDDPNAVKMPFPDDPSWQECLEVALHVTQAVVPDPTNGATHYYDASLDAHSPKWATDGSMEHVMDLGQFRFWKKAVVKT